MTKAKESFFSLGNKRFLAVLAGTVAFLVYCNTIPNFYNLDDELITENHILSGKGSSAFSKIFTEPYYKDKVGNKYEYRPVVLLSYFFEFMVFGRNPHVSHFFNVVLYSITCALLFYFLSLLLRDFEPDGSAKYPSGKKLQDRATGWMQGIPPDVVISLAITLMFTVHTIHTEVVASIKNRDEILSLLFGLLSWYCALRFVDSRKIGYYLLYIVFFIVGLFSKQTSITFALLVPASIILFRQISLQTLIALILPIQMITAIFSPIYLIYKKAALFAAQILFLIFFYYFMARRKEMIDFVIGIFRKIGAFFTKVWMLVVKFMRAFSIRVSNGMIIFQANYKVLLGTFLAIAVIIGGISLLKRKKEEIKQAQWNVSDAVHDFRELQVVPAMETPAPTIIPIAGRKLNYVEIPLLYEENPSVKLGTSMLTLRRYFQLMVIPFPLRFYYGYKQVSLSFLNNRKVIGSIAVYLTLTLLMLYLLAARKHLIAAFGLLFYLTAIIPLSNMLTPIAGVMAERLAYVASLGFCIGFSYMLLYPLFTRREKILGIVAHRLTKNFTYLFGIILLAYSGMTVYRNFFWKDHLTLMRHDIARMKESARGHHLLASHLAVTASEKRQTDPAEVTKLLQESTVHFKKAIEIYPEFPNAWYDLAKVNMLLGDTKTAIDAYTKAIKEDSNSASPCFELGIVLEKEGRADEAEKAYKMAIQRDSFFKEAYINLSYLYYRQERYEESIEVNQLGVKRLPSSYEINLNLGRTYLVLRDVSTALFYLERAVAINRSDRSVVDMIAQLFESIGNAEKANYYRNFK